MDARFEHESPDSFSLDEVSRRREELCAEIEKLANKKLQEVSAIELCYQFIEQAIYNSRLSPDEIESIFSKMRRSSLSQPIALSPTLSFSSLSSPLSQQKPNEGWMNARKLQHHRSVHLTSQLIPPEFGLLLESHGLPLSKEGKKVFAFIYHQLFISTTAIVDDYLSSLLTLVMKANLGGVRKNKAIDQIEDEVRSVMRKGLINYYNFFTHLGLEENLLKTEWLSYMERYLRRNLGVHNGWMRDQKYKEQLEKIRNQAKESRIDLEFSDNSGDFLGFELEYFLETFSIAQIIIQGLSEHCINQFSQTERGTDAVPEQSPE